LFVGGSSFFRSHSLNNFVRCAPPRRQKTLPPHMWKTAPPPPPPVLLLRNHSVQLCLSFEWHRMPSCCMERTFPAVTLCIMFLYRERDNVSYTKLILLCLAELPVFHILLLVCRGFLERTEQAFYTEHGLRNVRGGAKSPIKHKHGDLQDSINNRHRSSAPHTVRLHITAAT